MTMKEGIKKVASKAIDSKDEICDTLMKGGMEFKEASIAATILAKANLEQIIKGFSAGNLDFSATSNGGAVTQTTG